MDTGLAAIIASVLGNSVFYILFREQLKKADERQAAADARWQKVYDEQRGDNAKLLEIIMDLAKDATESRRPEGLDERIANQKPRKPPTRPLPRPE